MDFKLYTLVDITETGTHRGPDRIAVKQQANFNSVIQTVGMRANLVPQGVKQHSSSLSKLNFGSEYKGKHNYWEFSFSIDYGATSIEMLQEDFNLVPILNQLQETITIDPAIFVTKNNETCNIYFELLDK